MRWPQCGKSSVNTNSNYWNRRMCFSRMKSSSPRAQSSEASSICDSSKSLADIDLVPRLAAHSGRVELSGAAGRSWDHSRRRRLRPWAETHGSNPLLGLTMSPSTPSQSQCRQRQINTLTHRHTHTYTCTCTHAYIHALALSQSWARRIECRVGKRAKECERGKRCCVCVFVVERQRISSVFEKVIEALKFNSRPWPEDPWANAVYTVLCNVCLRGLWTFVCVCNFAS